MIPPHRAADACCNQQLFISPEPKIWWRAGRGLYILMHPLVILEAPLNYIVHFLTLEP